MTYRDLTKRLRRLECEFVRHAAGSHEIWWRPSNQRFTTIPRQVGRDLPAGTLAAILRDLGFRKRDLDNI